MDKVVIVMPAWNEAENIKKMVGVLVEDEFPKIKAEMHLLVVDNHSKDGTDRIIDEASKKNGNVHLIQQDKPGLGWAYVKGMRYAMENLKADAILEMDADFQHPPRFIKPMVDAYLTGAEYVIGSRYVKGGSIPKEWAFSRKFVSFFGNLFYFIKIILNPFHYLFTFYNILYHKDRRSGNTNFFTNHACPPALRYCFASSINRCYQRSFRSCQGNKDFFFLQRAYYFQRAGHS